MFDDTSLNQHNTQQNIQYISYGPRSSNSTLQNEEEINLTELMNQLPEHDQNMNIHITNNPATSSHNDNNNNENNNPNQASEASTITHKIILVFTMIFAVIFTQLQKLPITTRYIHQFLILHFLLSSCGLSSYLTLCPSLIVNNSEYWRLITYNFSDSNLFLTLFGCISLSDIVKRMEYHFGSIWIFYLIIINYIFISFFTFIIQFIFIYNDNDTFGINQCQSFGLYPLIFSLLIIESGLCLPYQLNHICGIFYVSSIYHPIIYCFLYNIFIRFDISVIITVIYTLIIIYILPCIYHLSRYRIQQLENSKWLGCMKKDRLFIKIETIDYQSFISTGKYISAQSCNNSDILLLNDDNNNNKMEQSFHSTMLLQGLSTDNINIMNNNIINDDIDDDNDREDLPFIRSDHSSDLSNISSSYNNNNNNISHGISPAINRLHPIQPSNDYWKHNNMPIGNVDHYNNTNISEEEEKNA